MKGPSPAVVDAVRRRDGHACIRCGMAAVGVRGWDWSLHHRRGRDSKPDSHLAQNLLTVCGASNVDGCHGYIHQHRTEAQDNGWWISRIGVVNDPLSIPVLVGQGSRWVYLGADARYFDEPPERAA
jgi:hypothetical protein